MDKQNRRTSVQSDQNEQSVDGVAGDGPCPLGKASLGRVSKDQGHTWSHAPASPKTQALQGPDRVQTGTAAQPSEPSPVGTDPALPQNH